MRFKIKYHLSIFEKYRIFNIRYPKKQMTRLVLLTLKDICIFVFACVKHAYLLISVCKMNYHTDVVNF